MIIPKYIAGSALFRGLMPADFITTNSLSVNILLYTNSEAANIAIGDNKEKSLGIRREVIWMNKPKGNPLLVTS